MGSVEYSCCVISNIVEHSPAVVLQQKDGSEYIFDSLIAFGEFALNQNKLFEILQLDVSDSIYKTIFRNFVQRNPTTVSRLGRRIKIGRSAFSVLKFGVGLLHAKKCDYA